MFDSVDDIFQLKQNLHPLHETKKQIRSSSYSDHTRCEFIVNEF